MCIRDRFSGGRSGPVVARAGAAAALRGEGGGGGKEAAAFAASVFFAAREAFMRCRFRLRRRCCFCPFDKRHFCRTLPRPELDCDDADDCGGMAGVSRRDAPRGRDGSVQFGRWWISWAGCEIRGGGCGRERESRTQGTVASNLSPTAFWNRNCGTGWNLDGERTGHDGKW